MRNHNPNLTIENHKLDRLLERVVKDEPNLKIKLDKDKKIKGVER